MLTISQVKNAKPKEKEYLLPDGHGLYLRVLPSGGKSWIYKYRRAGKWCKLRLGVFPEIGLAEVRGFCAKARHDVSIGKNPTSPVTETTPPEVASGELTVTSLIDRYLSGLGHLSETTRNESNRVLKKYIMPIIGDKTVSEVRRADAIHLVEKYSATQGIACPDI